MIIIDQGTHSTRVIVFSSDGHMLAQAAVPVSCQHVSGGQVEQDPLEIVRSIETALAQLSAQSSIALMADISQSALVVQRSSLLACRRDGRPITKVISWQDTRNQAWIDNHLDQLQKVRDITGLRMNAHYGASKIRWLLDNDEHVKSAYGEGDVLFVPLAAYLLRQLTWSTHWLVDAVIASRTMLLDKTTFGWNKELMNMLGIDEHCLPEVVRSDVDFGAIRFAENEIPLTLVGGDQSFVAFAAGHPLQQDCAFINVGTGAFVQIAAQDSPQACDLLYSPLVVGEHDSISVLEGTVNAAATALDWLHKEYNAEVDFGVIEQLFEREHTLPVFVNTVAGVGSPHWLPASPPFFIGDGDLNQYIIAVLESIVFAIADNIALMQRSQCSIKQVVIGGGLSRLNGFCQRLADILQLPVVQLQTHEVSAQGVAFYLLKKTYSENRQKQTFLPVDNSALKARYVIYQEAIKKLSTVR